MSSLRLPITINRSSVHPCMFPIHALTTQASPTLFLARMGRIELDPNSYNIFCGRKVVPVGLNRL